MALPVDSRVVSNLITTTIDAYLEDIEDGFFVDSPFTARLIEKDNIRIDGGVNVRQPFIYGTVGGGSHATGTPYDTSLKQVATYMLFPWSELYAPLTFDEIEQAKNEGEAAVIDYALLMLEVAELTLKDTFGNQTFATSPSLPVDMQSVQTGLVAFNSGSTYGGLTADTSAQGAALAPNKTNRINTTGGPFSFDMLQNTTGDVTYGRFKPDLYVTTQAIYNKMVNRSTPAMRFRNEDMQKYFGARGISFDDGDIMVDQKVPTGFIFAFNSQHIRLILSRGRSFVRRAALYGFDGRGFPIFNDSQSTDQIVALCQLVITGPRYSGYISNVT